MPKRFALLAAVAATGGLLLAACGDDQTIQTTPGQAAPAVEAAPVPAQTPTTTAAPQDIVDTAVAAGQFNTLAAALTEAGLVETLKGPGPFTVFAPNDAAFAKIPPATLNAILADEALLTKILTYHVVAGEVLAAQVQPGAVPTVEGSTIEVTVANGAVVLNGTTNVIATDIDASNGVIHVIDSVLIPPDVQLPSTR